MPAILNAPQETEYSEDIRSAGVASNFSHVAPPNEVTKELSCQLSRQQHLFIIYNPVSSGIISSSFEFSFL